MASRRVAVGFGDGVVRVLLRCADEWKLAAVAKPHKAAVTGLAYTPDATMLVTASVDQSLFFFAVAADSEALTPLGYMQVGRPPSFGSQQIKSSRGSRPHRPREDGLAHPAHTSRSNLASALALLSMWLSKPSTLVESSRASPPRRLRRRWTRPPCRHFKIQSCFCLGFALEVQLSKPLVQTHTRANTVLGLGCWGGRTQVGAEPTALCWSADSQALLVGCKDGSIFEMARPAAGDTSKTFEMPLAVARSYTFVRPKPVVEEEKKEQKQEGEEEPALEEEKEEDKVPPPPLPPQKGEGEEEREEEKVPL